MIRKLRQLWAPPASLQIQLMIAFMVVGIVPMFFAGELASKAVRNAYDHNLEIWLGETSVYFLGGMADSEREAESVASALAHDRQLVQGLIEHSAELPLLVGRLLDSEGFDLLVVLDDTGRIAYSSRPLDNYRRIHLGHELNVYQFDSGGITRAGISATQPFQYGGHQYQVLVGAFLDDQFFGRLSAVTSFNFRLYSIDAQGAKELYRSQAAAADASVVDDFVLRRLQEENTPLFYRAGDSRPYNNLYIPLNSDVGKLEGVLFCALKTEKSATWLSSSNIFLLIFLTGAGLSLLVGYGVSRQVSLPLRSLASGVDAIRAGDYRQRVRVGGHDEVGQLATAFNLMASRLEQLHELELQLRRQDRFLALGKIAAGIAHEVRNPLGIIRTSAELIRKRGALGSGEARLLENVISEVRRIDRLMTEFLSLEKPVQLSAAPVNVSALIFRIRSFCEPEFVRSGVVLEVDDQAETARVDGDPDALYQAILNVVLNAIEAMPGGGRLWIAQRIEGDSLLLSFRDTGTGIDDAVRDRVFDPFFTTKSQGTGLGLAKVLSVMQAHRAQVSVRNSETGGAIFEFSLPLSGNV